MQYVTEDELRRAYNAERFDTYELPAGSRLTPSARQFLIDFHVAFDNEEAPAAGNHTRAQGKEAPVKRESPFGAFTDDVRVLGARLRLLGSHALGIDNALAHALDALGSAWIRSEDLGCLLDGDADGEAEPAELRACLVPAIGAETHPLYLEVAVIDAELARAERFWASAETDMEAGEREALGRWRQAVGVIRDRFAEAACRAEGEVRRG